MYTSYTPVQALSTPGKYLGSVRLLVIYSRAVRSLVPMLQVPVLTVLEILRNESRLSFSFFGGWIQLVYSSGSTFQRENKKPLF